MRGRVHTSTPELGGTCVGHLITGAVLQVWTDDRRYRTSDLILVMGIVLLLLAQM